MRRRRPLAQRRLHAWQRRDLDVRSQYRDLLKRSHTIAVVGASPNRARSSCVVFSYLRTLANLDAIPINPKIEVLDGIRGYATLSAYAAERGAPDIVNVFRKSSEAPQIAHEALEIEARAIWFQHGIINDEAIRIVDSGG